MERERSQGWRQPFILTLDGVTRSTLLPDRGRWYLPLCQSGERNAVERATLVGVQGGTPCWGMLLCQITGTDQQGAKPPIRGVKGTLPCTLLYL